MSATVTVKWNDTWLKAATERAMRTAALQVKGTLEATKPARSIPVRGPYFGTQLRGAARGVRTGRGSTAVIRLGGLAPIFEKGADPHEIEPRGVSGKGRSRRRGAKALKFPDGNFATHVHHPGMRAQPFMRPAAARFPTYYRIALARALPKPRI